MDNVEPLTIKIPNKDTYMAYATVCPKEVLQDMWIKKIGKTINLFGISRIIKDVKITDDFITIDFI